MAKKRPTRRVTRRPMPVDDDVTLPGETTIVTESATTHDDETPEEQAQREADDKILEKMRRQFKGSVEAYSHFRAEAIKIAKFRAGTWGQKSFQWLDSIQAEREADGRPCITINRMPSFIHQVTNAARKANLSIRVSPVEDAGDPEIAEALQGMIRNVEVNSVHDRVYSTASDKQAESGFGGFYLATEWADNSGKVDPSAFRQRVRLKRERNPLRWYLPGNYEEPDASDASFAFRVADLDDDDFEDQMGEPAPDESDVSAFATEGDGSEANWFPSVKGSRRTRVVWYFNRENKGPKKRLALLSTGDVILYPDARQVKALAELDITVVRDRTIQPKVIVWRKCTALKIYETTEWVTDAVPFIPVIGDELEIEGIRDFVGVVRDAKQAALVYNAEVSGLVEAVARGIKTSVVGYRGQFGAPGSEQYKAWGEANRKPKAFLEIEPMDIDGKPAPPLQPLTWEPPIQGVVMAIRQIDEDYKTLAGFHDASLGQRGPQESGEAIDARKEQDSIGSSHYLDNLRSALVAAGKQLIQAFRKIHDVPQVVRYKGSDDQPKRVMIYSGAHNDPRQDKFLKPDPATGQKVPFALPKGVSAIYDLSVGEYHVEVSAGPDPGTRRQEAEQVILGVLKTMPPEFAMKFIDLAFGTIDEAIGRQMVARAKKLMPPELQDDASLDNADPETLKAMVAQLKGHIAGMQKELQQAGQIIQTKGVETDARKQIEQMKIDADERRQQFELMLQTMKDAANALDSRIIAAKEAFNAGQAAKEEALSQHRADTFQGLEAAKDRTHDLVKADQAHQHGKETAQIAATTQANQSEADAQREAAATAQQQAGETDTGSGTTGG